MTTLIGEHTTSEPKIELEEGALLSKNAALRAAFRRIDQDLRCSAAIPGATDYDDFKYVDSPHDDYKDHENYEDYNAPGL